MNIYRQVFEIVFYEIVHQTVQYFRKTNPKKMNL